MQRGWPGPPRYASPMPAPHAPTTGTDRLLSALDHTLRTLSNAVMARQPLPRPTAEPTDTGLSLDERRLSGALMRVNHVGEVCAQALYQGQALATTNPALRHHLLEAAQEEQDHLAWTHTRLQQLQARPSLLNPLWYAGAFALGWAAGRLGDGVSLGFVVETEKQVEQHLAGHLDRLPAADQASRAIVAQMKADEARHGQQATAAGARELPRPVQWAMKAAAQVMTRTAHHL